MHDSDQDWVDLISQKLTQNAGTVLTSFTDDVQYVVMRQVQFD